MYFNSVIVMTELRTQGDCRTARMHFIVTCFYKFDPRVRRHLH